MPVGIYIRTKEHNQKISKALTGRKVSDKTKKKLSEYFKGRLPWNIGKICPQLSKACKGHKLLDETKLKMSEARKGIKLSEETKRRMSIARMGHIGHMLGKKASQETKQKMSLSQRGRRGSNWKGGITLLNHLIRTNFKNRQWISDVFTRDDFTCQECGQRGGKLHAHHKKSFSSIIQYYEIITLKEAINCEELWNINNGITFCIKCHKKLHREETINYDFKHRRSLKLAE